MEKRACFDREVHSDRRAAWLTSSRISGVIVEERRIQIDVRLVDAIQDRKGWVRSYAAETSELPALQKQMADDVSTAVLSRRRP